MFLYPRASIYPRITHGCHVQQLTRIEVDNVHIEETMRHCGLLPSTVSCVVWGSNELSTLGVSSVTWEPQIEAMTRPSPDSLTGA